MTGPAAIAAAMCAARVVNVSYCWSPMALLLDSPHLFSAMAMLILLTPPNLRGVLPPCHFQPCPATQPPRMVMFSPLRRRTVVFLTITFGVAGAGVAIAAVFGGGCERGRTTLESSASSTSMAEG